MQSLKKLAVFCGSKTGSKKIYSEITCQFAQFLVKENITLIYGGGKVGLMGIIADEVLKHNGQVIGVMSKPLVEIEIAHNGLTHLHIVDTLSQGKALMAELAEGFILLPGGPGSLDEFFEMLTWAQLGYHQKPIGILNVAGYYDLMIELLKQMAEEGFFKKEYFQRIHMAKTAEELLTKMHSQEYYQQQL